MVMAALKLRFRAGGTAQGPSSRQPIRRGKAIHGNPGANALGMFDNTELIMLTLISTTEAIVAVLFNVRTLRRTIGVGSS